MNKRKLLGIILCYNKKPFKTKDLCKIHKLEYGTIVKQLSRLEENNKNTGFIKKISPGTWIITNYEGIIKYLDDGMTTMTKGTRGDTTPNLFLRLHNVQNKFKISNEINENLLLKDKWYRWESGKNSIHYKKNIILDCGATTKIIYHKGKVKRSMTLHVNQIIVNTKTLDLFEKSLFDSMQKIINELSLTYNFKFGLLEEITSPHFAIMDIELKDNKIKRKIELNQYFWLDYSMKEMFPELETYQKQQIQKLVNCPNRIDKVENKIVTLEEKILKSLENQEYKPQIDDKGDGYQ